MRQLPRILLTSLLLAWALGTADAQPQASWGEDSGSLHVFLEPLPSEFAGMRVRFDGVAAVGEDGTSRAVVMVLPEISGTAESRERRLASGRVRPGRYRSLIVRLSLQKSGATPSGTAPEPLTEVIESPVPFSVERGQAVTLRVSLRSAPGPADVALKLPKLTATVAPRPAADLLGLATSGLLATVTLFDKATGRVAAVVETGSPAAGLALDPRARRAWIAVPGANRVLLLELLAARVTNDVVLRAGDEPVDAVVTPLGETVLILNRGSRSVSFVDSASAVETARVAVGEEPRTILIDRAGQRAYVLNSGSSDISVIDVPGRRLAGTIGTDGGPIRGALSSDLERLYVVHESSPNLIAVDTVSLTESARLFIGFGATAIVLDSRRELVYVARRGSKSIEVYDPLSRLPVGSLPVPGEVSSLVIDVQTARLYAAFPELGEIQAYQLVGARRTARLEVGEGTHWLALMGEG